jgi:hypothetical protein
LGKSVVAVRMENSGDASAMVFNWSVPGANVKRSAR